MMQLKAPTRMQREFVTAVWWDMIRCPLPPDVDARRIGPFIRGELKKLGYTGPLTITAVGILSEHSPDFLQDLVSTGIHLRHVPTADVKVILRGLGMQKSTNVLFKAIHYSLTLAIVISYGDLSSGGHHHL